MDNDLELVIRILTKPSRWRNRFRRKFRSLIESVGERHGIQADSKMIDEFFESLSTNRWAVIRRWLAQDTQSEFVEFLTKRGELFFRQRRKLLKARTIDQIPWSAVIERATLLPPRDKILARYCLVDGLSGVALKRAIRADLRLDLATSAAIVTSRSNIIRRLRIHCAPEHEESIDALLRLRQRSGRRPKSPKSPNKK